MANIAVLDQSTINQIAAGEVIERPASVVKELVENSIDAGATAVTVEIKEGGISFIRITDNGSGINEKELPLAFLRHSTSKIKSAIDLLSVKSLGFRGEALSSIAAVSQVELITKTKDAFTGSRYVIEGGKETSIESIGAPDGTTFIVRNLFYNTPARRKFLKSPVTEAGYIGELIERLAVSHPDVSFRFINNNQPKLHTSGNTNLKDIIYHIYGRDIAANIINVTASDDDISVNGFIGKPVVTRGNRNYENYYINGRYIKSSIISKAIEEAYKPFIMQHRYPFTALHFNIRSDSIDINVHPTKMELRFSDNQKVYQFVLNAVSHALTHKEMIPDVRVNDAEHNKSVIKELQEHNSQRVPEPFENKRIAVSSEFRRNEPAKNVTYRPEPAKSPVLRENTPVFNKPENKMPENKPQEIKTPAVQTSDNSKTDAEIKTDINPEVKQDIKTVPESEINNTENIKNIENTENIKNTKPEEKYEQLKFLDEKAMISHKILGQLFDTYWLVEYGSNLYIIDQHAAHEKVLYERTMKKLKDGGRGESQVISPPVIITLNMREEEVLKNNIDFFKELGYEIESFGGKEYSISAVPANLFGIATKELLVEMLDDLVEENLSKQPDIIKDKIATMSCKAAVKGNNKLSFMEIKALINELLTLDNPYNCPHGRPTIISMSKYEIEKKFKRIV